MYYRNVSFLPFRLCEWHVKWLKEQRQLTRAQKFHQLVFRVHQANQPILSKDLLVRWFEIIRAKYSFICFFCGWDLVLEIFCLFHSVNNLIWNGILIQKHSIIWPSDDKLLPGFLYNFLFQQGQCLCDFWPFTKSFLSAITTFYRTPFLLVVVVCLLVCFSFFNESPAMLCYKNFGKFES